MMTDLLYEALLPHVLAAAGGFRKLGVERDDLEQELWATAIEHQRTFERYVNDDNPDRGEASIRAALTNTARTFSLKEKAQRDGYRLTDLYFYSPATIRELLPFVWDHSEWLSTGQTDGGPSGAPANEGGNRLAMLVDVSSAVGQLPDADQALLRQRYGDGVELHELGPMWDSTEEAIRKRIDRLVRRLLNLLGGPRPDFDGPGSRKAMRNGTAQAITAEGTE